VIVWADDTTRAYGNISARGGQQAAMAGLSKPRAQISRLSGRVDTRAPQGKAGTLLLDP